MKTIQLIFVFVILNNCFTQIIDQCNEKFVEILSDKCKAIDPNLCRYNRFDKSCFTTNACSKGNNDPDLCKTLIHPDFHKMKCQYNNGVCEEAKKECSDYGIVAYQVDDTPITINGDVCEDLTPKPSQGNYCFFSTSCRPYLKLCQECGNRGLCEGNIPITHSQKCVWENTERGEACNGQQRQCGDNFANIDGSKCPDLKVTDSTKYGCVYSGSGCVQTFISCQSYDSNTCDGNRPLTADKSDYDYTKYCSWNSVTNRCDTKDQKCSDYNSLSSTQSDLCPKLKVTDSNKVRCVYDTSGCKEEYNSCKLYNDNEIEKTRAGCEGVKPLDPNKECFYRKDEDICEERDIYSSCEQYEGSDKKICESIISPKTNSSCILDKDSKCIERTFHCSEVYNEYDCLYFAKPFDENKKCAFDRSHSPVCYEEYLNCEDYADTDATICSDIILYNGKKCEIYLDKCKTISKTCEDANSKEECKMIAHTGVYDPEKMVCDYIDGVGCRGVYKYCSDYRGDWSYSDAVTNCTRIKPYDKTGEHIDNTSKCVFEDASVGCERVPKKCSDAGSNPIMCEYISPFIKDNKVKHCVFSGGSCKEYFKTCEDYNKNVEQNKCENNIVLENQLTHLCEFQTVDGINKCVTKKECPSFVANDYKYLCYNINSNCSYDDTYNICYEKEKTCSQMKFYKDSDENEALCQSFEVTNPNQICALKEDRSGCELVYKESIFAPKPPQESNEEGNASQFLVKGISFVLILLCFIF